jgi:ribonuclease P protein component
MAEGHHPRLRLPRCRRLQTSADFKRVREQGRRLAKGTLVANWMALSPNAPSRLGVITSRKIGKSTRRSRARRLMREVFRLHQHNLATPVEMVLIARPSINGKTFQTVERDYLLILQQARLLKKNQ